MATQTKSTPLNAKFNFPAVKNSVLLAEYYATRKHETPKPKADRRKATDQDRQECAALIKEGGAKAARKKFSEALIDYCQGEIYMGRL